MVKVCFGQQIGCRGIYFRKRLNETIVNEKGQRL